MKKIIITVEYPDTAKFVSNASEQLKEVFVKNNIFYPGKVTDINIK